MSRSWTNTTAYRKVFAHGSGDNETNGIAICSVMTPDTPSKQDWIAGDLISFSKGWNKTSYPRAMGPISGLADGTKILFSTILSGTTARNWKNGSQLSTRVEQAGASAPDLNPFYIGNNFGTGGQFWDGDIAEILFYNYELSDAARKKVESYLNTKWGLY